MSSSRLSTFVSSAPGLEALLGRELAALGFSPTEVEGGVELRATSDELVRLAFGSAIAEGVRIRLKSFVARDFAALQAGVKKLPLRAYFAVGTKVRVRVTCHRSKLWHSGAVEERVVEVLRDHVGLAPVDDEKAEQTLFVRITGDAVQLSVDAGGRMHRRGYRTHVEKASLRETLAAALVRLAEETWQGPPSAIWDPFCGAGTIALEAARHFAGVSPGLERRFPFEDFPTHDAASARRIREELAQTPRRVGPAIFASDLSEKALEAARANAERSGVPDAVTFLGGDFEALVDSIPRGATIVTNPPYGERLEGAGLMKRFDRLLTRRADLRPALLLVGGAAKKELPGRFQNVLATKNGGLSVAVRRLA